MYLIFFNIYIKEGNAVVVFNIVIAAIELIFQSDFQ